MTNPEINIQALLRPFAHPPNPRPFGRTPGVPRGRGRKREDWGICGTKVPQIPHFPLSPRPWGRGWGWGN